MSQNSFGPPAKRNFTAGIAAAMGANSYQGQSHNKKMKKSISCSDCGQVFHQVCSLFWAHFGLDAKILLRTLEQAFFVRFRKNSTMEKT